VTSIGSYAFSKCTGLTEINYNATLAVTGSEVFTVFGSIGASKAGITVNIGANVTKIPAGLFSASASGFYEDSGGMITTVNFASGSVCQSIDNYAFYKCSGLKSITIPSSVTSIGNSAFYECSGLTSVTFQGMISSNNFSSSSFPGDLRNKYLAGGVGTYTRTSGSEVWTKQ